MTTAYVNAISTSRPQNDVHHAFIEFAASSFSDERTEKIFRRMTERAHISHRWSVLNSTEDFYNDDPNSISLHTRMKAYELLAPQLAIDAVNQLRLGNEASLITHVIVVTCTGFYTPGIDFDVIQACNLNPEVECTQIAFMGCYSGVNGLKLARHIVRSEPQARVLLVTVELSTLHLQQSDNLEEMLSYLIFSDGAAAALITNEASGLSLDSFYNAVIPETKDLMTLKIGQRSIEMFLSGKVPGALSRALSEPAVMKSILGEQSKSDIDIWAIHPGGRSILDAVGRALELNKEELGLSRYILNNYGNMASVTILFVLKEILAQKSTPELQGKSGCALAFGPGLSAETFLFHV